MAEDKTKALKISRRNEKGKLTRQINALMQILNEDDQTIIDTADAKTRIKSIKESFALVEAKHDVLVDIIEDEQVFETEEEWMEDCQRKFINDMQALERKLKAVIDSKHKQNNDATEAEKTHDATSNRSESHNCFMQRNTATLLLAGARRIAIWMNLHNVSDFILNMIEILGTIEDVEEVRAQLINTCMTAVELVTCVSGGIRQCMMYLGNCHIPIFTIIKKMIHRPLDDAEKNNIVKDYIAGLVEDGEYKVIIEEAYNKWKMVKVDAIKKLRDVADEIDNNMKNSRLAKIAGSVVSITGTVCVLGALANPVGIAAVGVFGTTTGVAGGIATLGADFYADKVMKKALEFSNDILQKQEESTNYLLNLLAEHKKQTKDHMKTAEMIDEVAVRFKQLPDDDRMKVTLGIGDLIEENIGFVKSDKREQELCIEGNTFNIAALGKGMIRAGGAVLNVVDNVADDALKLPLQQVKALKGAVKVVGVLTNTVITAIDIYTIVNTSVEMSKGSTVEAAKRIREAAKALESREIPELEDVIVKSILHSAKECRIPEEVFD